MESSVEVEEVIHYARGDNAAAIAQPEAGGKVRPFSAARGFRGGREREESDDLAALTDLDLFAFFDPVEDGAEIMADLPDGGRFHV